MHDIERHHLESTPPRKPAHDGQPAIAPDGLAGRCVLYSDGANVIALLEGQPLLEAMAAKLLKKRTSVSVNLEVLWE